MIRVTTLLASLFTVFTTVFGQSDTIYINQNWETTSRDSAFYFRPPMVKVENGYLLKDYYMSGVLQAEGVTMSETEESFDGPVIWYFQSGNVSTKTVFVKGVMEGNSTTYREDGTVIASAEYKAGVPFSGTIGSEENGVTSIDNYENSILVKHTVTSIDSLSKAKLSWVMLDSVNSKLSQYNQFGEFIGDFYFKGPNFESLSGVLATYIYNPMVVVKISHMSDGVNVNPTNYYYTNGKRKKDEFLDVNSYYSKNLEIVYNNKGDLLDSLTYKDGHPFNGTQYEFFYPEYQSALSDIIMRSTPYKNGAIDGTVLEYYLNGAKRTQKEYKDGRAEGYSIHFDSLGVEKMKALYKGGYPWEGSVADEYVNSVATYKDGILLVEKGYHSNGKPSVYKDAKQEIYYDSLGVVIGRLEKRDGVPYSGKQIGAYNGVISNITEYSNGKVLCSTDYSNGLPSYKAEFSENGDALKRTEYYLTGEVKSVVQMDRNSEIDLLFFDKAGKQIGKRVYDANLGYSGEIITFNKDSIESIEVYKNDKLIKNKRYNNNGVLYYDIDYNGPSVVYDLDNNKAYHLTYKDGEPYDGTEVNHDSYSYHVDYERNYKNGMLEGPSIEYLMLTDYTNFVPQKITNYSRNKKNGVEQTFINGILASEITYSNDYINGSALYYDARGKIIAKATYKDDIPMDGVVYEFDYKHQPSTIVPYSNGKIDGEAKYYTDNVLDITLLYDNDEIKKRVTYVDGKAKYTLHYKDQIKFEGEERISNLYTQYKEGVDVLYIDYSYDNPEQIIRKREVVGDKIFETNYFESGKKKSTFTVVSNNREGEAIAYSVDGDEIARGVFSENVPSSGSFVYFSINSDSAYLKLELQPMKIVVKELVDGQVVGNMQYDLTNLNSGEMYKSTVINILDGMRTMNKGYEIGSYY